MVVGFVVGVVSLIIVAFHCSLLLALFVVGVCFDQEYTVHSVLSSFALIWLAKKVVVLLLLPVCCRMADSVLCLYLYIMMPWVGMRCVIVAFFGHTCLRFVTSRTGYLCCT